MDLSKLTIKEAHKNLKNKKISALELTELILSNIKKQDKDIRAYLSVTEELALNQAKRVDKKIANGEQFGVLSGIPIAVKDIILAEGLLCTAGSKILENYIAPYDATVIKRLKKSGGVIVGKANLDEFAMGSSTENSAFGSTKNPYDFKRVPGGSSGGSAAAVAANECLYSLGSDTGGSIRQPASFCGIVGLKPTYGSVSRYGLVAFASSLDQIGPMAKTAEDVKLVFNAIAGKDVRDSTSAFYENHYNKNSLDFKNLKIGLPKEYFVEGIDSEVEKKVRQAISKYENMGAQVEEISLPHTEYALPCYYIIMPAEASANLARYEGIKYGKSRLGESDTKIDTLMDVYLENRDKGFGDEVKRRIMMGTYALSAGYYDAYYLKAQKVRSLIKQDFDKAFESVDVIMGPTCPTTAFKLGEKSDDPISMYLSDVYTVPANLAGLPAVSVPAGFDKDNMPVGFQIIGKAWQEEQILDIATEYEKKN